MRPALHRWHGHTCSDLCTAVKHARISKPEPYTDEAQCLGLRSRLCSLLGVDDTQAEDVCMAVAQRDSSVLKELWYALERFVPSK